MKPESPEDLARQLAEQTAHLRVSPALAARVVARARAEEAFERPAFVVLAFAASLVVWLSFGFDRAVPAASGEADDDVALTFEGEESAL